MPQPNDLSRSLVILEQDATLIAVIEMGQSSWLVAGIVPGVERSPLKKLAVDESALLKLLNRWREEAEKAGHRIERIAIAFEAGRDGFWLARWLRARGIEAHVIHASSVAVSREHRRAKTDRLDTELLKRAFLGWLRGERDHCKMVAIPTLAQEDAKRPNRERESLVGEQSRIVNRMKAALARLGIRGAALRVSLTSNRVVSFAMRPLYGRRGRTTASRLQQKRPRLGAGPKEIMGAQPPQASMVTERRNDSPRSAAAANQKTAPNDQSGARSP